MIKYVYKIIIYKKLTLVVTVKNPNKVLYIRYQINIIININIKKNQINIKL